MQQFRRARAQMRTKSRSALSKDPTFSAGSPQSDSQSGVGVGTAAVDAVGHVRARIALSKGHRKRRSATRRQTVFARHMATRVINVQAIDVDNVEGVQSYPG